MRKVTGDDRHHITLLQWHVVIIVHYYDSALLKWGIIRMMNYYNDKGDIYLDCRFS